MAQRLVEIRTGEIDEDVLAPDGVVPERAVPGNSRMRIDELQAREPPRQAAEVAPPGARSQMDQHRLVARLAEVRDVGERRDRIAMPDGMRLDAYPARTPEAGRRPRPRRSRACGETEPA